MGSRPSKRYEEPAEVQVAEPAPTTDAASSDLRKTREEMLRERASARPAPAKPGSMMARATMRIQSATVMYGRLSVRSTGRMSSTRRVKSMIVRSKDMVKYEDAFEDTGGIILGEGRQVVVTQAIRKADRTVVAVRALSSKETSVDELHRQLAVYETVSKAAVHPNIVKIVGLSFNDEDDELHVMFKIYKGGELLDAIVSRDQPWVEADARELLRKLFEALRFVHDQGIVHRQVRAENILLSAEGDLSKIALGGWSLATTAAERAVTDGRRRLRVSDEATDIQYLAPEVLEDSAGDGDGSYGAAQDVWALGVLYHILLAGKPPVDAASLDEAAFEAACRSYALDRAASWASVASPEGLDFLESLLSPDPRLRPSAEDCLAHPYMGVAISRATVLNPDNLRAFANRRKKKLKRAKTKLKFVVRLIIQANRARRHRQEQNALAGIDVEAGAPETAAADAAAAADAPAVVSPPPRSPSASHEEADIEETVVLPC